MKMIIKLTDFRFQTFTRENGSEGQVIKMRGRDAQGRIMPTAVAFYGDAARLNREIDTLMPDGMQVSDLNLFVELNGEEYESTFNKNGKDITVTQFRVRKDGARIMSGPAAELQATRFDAAVAYRDAQEHLAAGRPQDALKALSKFVHEIAQVEEDLVLENDFSTGSVLNADKPGDDIATNSHEEPAASTSLENSLPSSGAEIRHAESTANDVPVDVPANAASASDSTSSDESEAPSSDLKAVEVVASNDVAQDVSEASTSISSVEVEPIESQDVVVESVEPSNSPAGEISDGNIAAAENSEAVSDQSELASVSATQAETVVEEPKPISMQASAPVGRPMVPGVRPGMRPAGLQAPSQRPMAVASTVQVKPSVQPTAAPISADSELPPEDPEALAQMTFASRRTSAPASTAPIVQQGANPVSSAPKPAMMGGPRPLPRAFGVGPRPVTASSPNGSAMRR